MNPVRVPLPCPLRPLIALAVLAFSVLPAAARFSPPACRNAFTPEQEIEEGGKAAQEVMRTQPMLAENDPITLYVQQLGAKLVAHAPGTKWPFHFHVTNEADINAFALPGGAVFVNLAAVQAAETEAQLAGVMAHEISHVVLRHSTCNITKQQRQSTWLGLGQLAAGILLPGTAGALAQTGIGFGAQTLFLSYSREAEKQADLLGTDILYDAGYDPRGMPQFFEVIEGRYGAGGAQFLSDHPNPGNRIDYVQAEIDSLPPRSNNVRTSAEFTRIHKLALERKPYTAEQIKSGEWKRGAAGAAAGATGAPAAVDFAPSADTKLLTTSAYSIRYPANWMVANAGGADATIAPMGGARGQTILYGILIGSFTPRGGGAPPDSGPSLEEQFGQLVQAMLAQNPGLAVARAAEPITVKGQPAMDAELRGDSALTEAGQPLKEKDWLVGIPRGDGSMLFLVFIAPERDRARLQPAFDAALRSLTFP